jgi:hypothetical protein
MRGFFTAVKYMMELIHHFKIYKTRVEIPADFIDSIYKLKEAEAVSILQKTNIGGWHSKTFTPYKDYYNGRYKWTTNIIESLTSIVQHTWPNVIFNRAWFNMSYPGGTNRWHDHGSHPIVSVLYIKTPTPCSSIEFRQDSELFQYRPIAGDFLVFPGTLEHRVLENESIDERISMAINFSDS